MTHLTIADYAYSCLQFLDEVCVIFASIESFKDISFAGINIYEKYAMDSVKHWIPHKELQNAIRFGLDGLVPGGRPPAKLRQANLNHALVGLRFDDCSSVF